MAIDKITTASITDANITTAKIASGVLQTNTPTFRAFISGNAFTLANGADTTVVFNGISFNPQSTFNGSNGRFTPGVSGKYFLHANVRLSATNDQGIFDIYLRKNSSTVASNRVRGSGTGNLGITISDVVESDTDDYFYIQIYQATGSDITASIDTVSYFTGYKIIE